MEINHVLPEGERNNFVDPEKHLSPHVRHQDFDTSVRANDIACSGMLIINAIRVSKLTKVKTLVEKCSEQLKGQILELYGRNPLICFITEQNLMDFDGFTLCAIKYLANAGFIKLRVAERFEDSKVVQYHATAVPDFRDGKFQL